MLPAVSSVMPPRKPGIFYEPYHTAPCVNRFFFFFFFKKKKKNSPYVWVRRRKYKRKENIAHCSNTARTVEFDQPAESHQSPVTLAALWSAADQESRIQGREPVREKAYLVL